MNLWEVFSHCLTAVVCVTLIILSFSPKMKEERYQKAKNIYRVAGFGLLVMTLALVASEFIF